MNYNIETHSVGLFLEYIIVLTFVLAFLFIFTAKKNCYQTGRIFFIAGIIVLILGLIFLRLPHIGLVILMFFAFNTGWLWTIAFFYLIASKKYDHEEKVNLTLKMILGIIAIFMIGYFGLYKGGGLIISLAKKYSADQERKVVLEDLYQALKKYYRVNDACPSDLSDLDKYYSSSIDLKNSQNSQKLPGASFIPGASTPTQHGCEVRMNYLFYDEEFKILDVDYQDSFDAESDQFFPIELKINDLKPSRSYDVREGEKIKIQWNAPNADYCRPIRTTNQSPRTPLVSGGYWTDLKQLGAKGQQQILAHFKPDDKEGAHTEISIICYKGSNYNYESVVFYLDNDIDVIDTDARDQAVLLVNNIKDVIEFNKIHPETYVEIDDTKNTNEDWVVQVWAMEGDQTILQGYYKVNKTNKKIVKCITSECK